MKCQAMKLTCIVLLYSLTLPQFVAGRKIMFVLNTETQPEEGATKEEVLYLETDTQKRENVNRILLRGGSSFEKVRSKKSKGKKSKGTRTGQSYSYNRREMKANSNHQGQSLGIGHTMEFPAVERNLSYRVVKGHELPPTAAGNTSSAGKSKSIKSKYKSYIYDKGGKHHNKRRIAKFEIQLEPRPSNMKESPWGRAHSSRVLKQGKNSKKKSNSATKGKVGKKSGRITSSNSAYNKDHSYSYIRRGAETESMGEEIPPEQFPWGRPIADVEKESSEVSNGNGE